MSNSGSVENALPQVQDSPRIEATETSSASSDNDVQMDQSPPPDDASTSNPSAEDAMALDGQDAMGANLDRPPGDLGSASGITDSEKEYHVSEADESDEESLEDASDGYEPPEPGPLGDVDTLHAPNTNSPPPNVADLSLDNSDNDLQGVAETSPLNHQISTGQQDSISESGREVDDRPGMQCGQHLTTSRSNQHGKIQRLPLDPALLLMRRPCSTSEHTDSIPSSISQLLGASDP